MCSIGSNLEGSDLMKYVSVPKGHLSLGALQVQPPLDRHHTNSRIPRFVVAGSVVKPPEWRNAQDESNNIYTYNDLWS